MDARPAHRLARRACLFVATAVTTEAVSGVVGIADVLGGHRGAPRAARAGPAAAARCRSRSLGATLFGLYSKESALCIVPLAPLAALLTAQITHPERPLRWVRALVAAVATGAAFVFYVEMRRALVPGRDARTSSRPKPTPTNRSLRRAFAAALRWYAQPMLPHDPLNNPLIEAPTPYRIAGALRVYARGLGQVRLPAGRCRATTRRRRSPSPPGWSSRRASSARLAMIVPARWRARCWGCSRGCASAPRRERRDATRARTRTQDAGRPAAASSAFAMVWIVVSYFPVSNIPVVLPDRARGALLVLPGRRLGASPRARSSRSVAAGAPQRRGWLAGGRGRRSRSSSASSASPRAATRSTTRTTCVFWNATRKAVPRSAKAHLNYSVMLGARGDLPGRLESNAVALELAPQWPMASVYMGDTLCRLHRAPEARPHYLRGFALGPNEMSLIALGLQCLWDEQQLGDDSTVRAPAAGRRRSLPRLVAQVPRRRHARERRRVQGRQPEVPPPRLQRRPEEGRVRLGPGAAGRGRGVGRGAPTRGLARTRALACLRVSSDYRRSYELRSPDASASATTMPIDAAMYGARAPTLAYSHPPVAGPNVRARLANDWLTPSVPPWRSGGARREMNAEVDGCVRPLPRASSAPDA